MLWHDHFVDKRKCLKYNIVVAILLSIHYVNNLWWFITIIIDSVLRKCWNVHLIYWSFHRHHNDWLIQVFLAIIVWLSTEMSSLAEARQCVAILILTWCVGGPVCCGSTTYSANLGFYVENSNNTISKTIKYILKASDV